MNKKSYFTIQEALNYIDSLKMKAERTRDLLGFKSVEISKEYKNLISLANSFSIIFLQYDLHDVALHLLKYSSDADLKLSRYGASEDKLWEGSLITYNNLILLFHKVNHHKDSLKLVFQSQSFLNGIKNANLKLSADIEICTHLVAFISLWRVGNPECVNSLQFATDILNSFIQKESVTRFSSQALDNLYGLIAVSLSAIKVVVEKNKQEAVNILKSALDELSQSAECRGLLEIVLGIINQTNKVKAPEENEEDWLCGKLYNKLLIANCFLPLVDIRTPLIMAEELEAAKTQELENGGLLEIKPLVLATEPKVEPVKKSRIRPSANREKPTAGFVATKKPKPWWESKEFKAFEVNTRRAAGFASEPRGKKLDYNTRRSIDHRSRVMGSPLNFTGKNSTSMFDKLLRMSDDVTKSVKDLDYEIGRYKSPAY